MDVVIRKKSVYISAADILLVQVEHLDVRIILEDHTCNDFVADLQRFSCAVHFYIFTHLYDLAGSLVSERYRDQSERVFLNSWASVPQIPHPSTFTRISPSPHFRDRELFDIIVLK